MRNGQLNNGFSIFIQFFKSSMHPLSTEKLLKDMSTCIGILLMNRNHNIAGGKLLKDLPHHIGIEHMSQERQKNTYANSNTMAAVDTNINTSAKKMMS